MGIFYAGRGGRRSRVVVNGDADATAEFQERPLRTTTFQCARV
jgi:hypothetical protein